MNSGPPEHIVELNGFLVYQGYSIYNTFLSDFEQHPFM